MNTINSHTRVQVTVEIDGSSYGEDWTLSKLAEQSGREAVIALSNKLNSLGVRIIGEPKVLITHVKD